jgi:hypothetical protein
MATGKPELFLFRSIAQVPVEGEYGGVTGYLMQVKVFLI